LVGIIGIVAFLTVLALSLAITRVATLVLAMTGLSWEAARFQARSAFTGTGFTTREAEGVVAHPVRRRVVMWLMILHSAGLVTIIISLVLSVAGSSGGIQNPSLLLWLGGGAGALWLVARSKLLDRALARAVGWPLRRRTDLDARDYASLLRLSGEYRIMKINLREDDWLVGKTLQQCNLRDEGVNILGIYRRDGSYVGAPKAETELYTDDTLILYGRSAALRDLDQRGAGAEGDLAHGRAASEERGRLEKQDRREREHKQRRDAERRAG
jgi:hypothetical protein